MHSGLHDKLSNTKLVSNEWYAHTALDKMLGGEKDFNELSFNLLVAGELEIIGNPWITSKRSSPELNYLRN